MTNHSEKIIFLLIVIIAIFFARLVYPNISGVPTLADTEQAQPSSTAVAPSQEPPKLVLPQTTVSATAPPDGNAADAGSATVSPASATALPKFTSQAYLVADLATGNVVAGANTNNRWPTASITKLMTATVALDHLTSDTRITISPQMFAADPDEHTLAIGDTYTAEDLLHLLLMPSSNVAAEALAGYVGRAQFMDEMNQRAQSWGMTNSYFDDPSGISAANQSTAQDLLTLARHLYQNYPNVLALTNTPVATITELNSGRRTTVKSINVFAGTPGFIGGKTGNTPQASANLISIFNANGTPVVITVLGAPSLPFQSTSMLYSWYKTNYK